MAEPCVTGHQVMIHDRGGQRRLHELKRLTEVNYTRGRSITGDALVTISGKACEDQADVIDRVARGVMRYEMVIFRGDERVFEGPLIRVPTGRSSAQFLAKDVSEYLNGTPLSQDYPIATGEQRTPGDPDSPWLMTERVRAIIEHELTESYDMLVGTGTARVLVTVPRWEALEVPANILPYLDIRRSETLYTRSDTKAMQMSVGEHLSNLAEGGLDYTTIGRRVIIWDAATPHGQIRRLTDADFQGELLVSADGTDYAAVGHVSASRPEPEEGEVPPTPEPGVVPGVGNAGQASEFYGPWTRITSLDQEEGSTEPTQDELNSQARRVTAASSSIPTSIRIPDNAGIILSDTLRLSHLVPGVIVPVASTLNLRPVEQDQRLDKVSVTENATGETVTVSMSSAGLAGLRPAPRTQAELLGNYKRRIGALERRLRG